jgi:predicted DNA-binding transcriptional regulator AlpA
MDARHQAKYRDAANVSLQISAVLDSRSIDALKQAIREAVAEALQSQRPPVDVDRERRIRASKWANLGGRDEPQEYGLLVDTRAASKLLGVSPRKIFDMKTNGRMPKAMKVGRVVRWSHQQLVDWVNAGCPPCVNGEFSAKPTTT